MSACARHILAPAVRVAGILTGAAMVDDLKNRGPADRIRVNVNEAWEVTYWCKEFGCTAQQLKDAVRAVGVMADKVRIHLKK